MTRSIETRADFSIVRYSSCWEDADILLEALNLRKNQNFLSIASAGDNSFSLLTTAPSLVLAIDLNPAQLACVELKKAAFFHLSYEELIGFLGIVTTEKRIEIFQKIKNDLSSEAKRYWENNLDAITKGIIHIGKFEDYFRLFRKWCLPLIHSKKRIAQLLKAKSRHEQEKYYHEKWNTIRWRLLFKLFFSKKVMGKYGRDPEFFKYVKTSVSDRIFARAEYALSSLPTDNNPYLEYILTGNFQQSLPHYLRKNNYDAIKENIDKLVLFKGGLTEAFNAYPEVKFDGFNLSDIFEYMNVDEYEKALGSILDRSAKNAKIAFWNMLAYRKEVKSLKDRINFLDEEANELHQKDKAFFYQSFVIGVAK